MVIAIGFKFEKLGTVEEDRRGRLRFRGRKRKDVRKFVLRFRQDIAARLGREPLNAELFRELLSTSQSYFWIVEDAASSSA